MAIDGSTMAAWAARAAHVAPGGVHSNVRLGSPRVFFDRGAGARLWDIEGKEYVDHLLGQGPAFLGHAHPAVTAGVTAAVRDGMVFGAQNRLEVEAGEQLLGALGWADRVRFGVSGTEAVQGALRLARAATGRRKVLRFIGHYHGWLDNVLMDFSGTPGPASLGQSPDDLRDWVLAAFNDAAGARAAALEHADDLAAIIVEPVMCNTGAVAAAPEFLRSLRSLADEVGAVLVLDEVITGFRLSLGGAAEFFDVQPDLAVYGKALAGGWPVSAVAGRAALMDRFGTGEVNHSGTFNASMMACAAVLATIRALREDPPYERVHAHGTELMGGISDLAASHGLTATITGVPAAFHLTLDGEDGRVPYADVAGLLCDRGVWVAGRGIWYTSAAHGDAELKAVLDAIDGVLGDITEAPVPGQRR